MSSTGHPSDSPFTHIYDYIVVGGGTSGPVVARRLADSDPTAHVLLIEAGPIQQGIVNSQMAMGWQNIPGSVYDWGYDTTPQQHANNRIIHLPRGKLLGGCRDVFSAAFNGTLIIRGPKADYDRWAEAGCVGWAWDDVLPYFKMSENFNANPELPITQYHGTSGPLHTTVHPFAPISTDILKSYQEQGFQYKPDMFVEGEGEGVGHAVRTVCNGIRTTGADFVSPATSPTNMTVLTSTLALRIILSRGCPTFPPRAVAIEVESLENIDSTGAPLKFIIHARREIVLSAGAYNSPVLLMQSGIGPRQHLHDVNLECTVDLKGVGSNLQDHLIVLNFYELNKPELTYDRLIYPRGAVDLAVKEWLQTQTGVMSRFPFGPFAYKRMNGIMKDIPEWKDAQASTALEDPTGQHHTQPHIEYFSTELYGGGPQFTDFPSDPSQSAFAMITMLTCPQSRGTIRLAPPTTPGTTPDPHAHPIIDHAYLSSPLDLAILTEGVRLAHKIVLEGSTTRHHVAGPWPKHGTFPQDTQAWREYVKANVGTCYHPSGTCKMGPEGDDWAVVDERLRVKGVIGLRIADCSIMPWINNGHTQAPAYMIGEKCAAFVSEDHTATQHCSRDRIKSNSNSLYGNIRAHNQG